MERIENDRIAKQAYVRECSGICSGGRPWKRWIDIVKECLKKRGLDVQEAKRMVHQSTQLFLSLYLAHY